MRWTTKLLLTIVAALLFTFTLFVVTTSIFEWLYAPEILPVEEHASSPSDIDTDPEEGTLLSKTKSNFPFELDPRKGKLELFERITSSGQATRNLGFLVGLTALLFFSLYVYWKRKRRLKRTDDSHSNRVVPPEKVGHNKGTDAPSPLMRLTNVPIRDALITFNQSLTPAKRLRSHETLQDWFSRIQLPMNESAVYYAIRYGASWGEPVSEEDIARFQHTLDHYAARPHPE